MISDLFFMLLRTIRNMIVAAFIVVLFLTCLIWAERNHQMDTGTWMMMTVTQ